MSSPPDDSTSEVSSPLKESEAKEFIRKCVQAELTLYVKIFGVANLIALGALFYSVIQTANTAASAYRRQRRNPRLLSKSRIPGWTKGMPYIKPRIRKTSFRFSRRPAISALSALISSLPLQPFQAGSRNRSITYRLAQSPEASGKFETLRASQLPSFLDKPSEWHFGCTRTVHSRALPLEISDLFRLKDREVDLLSGQRSALHSFDVPDELLAGLVQIHLG
jgi:hypothetical protein